MNNENKNRFTAVIADVEPITFVITPEEEQIFQKASYHVNDVWRKMQKDQPCKSSHYILAKVALAFAELYYRKSEQLNAQSQMLEDFERDIDSILLSMED